MRNRGPVEFTARTFDATVVSDEEGERGTVLLEGITTTIGSTGMGVQGKVDRHVKPETLQTWLDKPVVVNLYTAGRDLKNVQGTILSIGDAPESRYRWYFAIKFDEPIRLNTLNVNRRK